MTKTTHSTEMAPMDRMGLSLAALLSQANASELPHDVTERLKVARQHALAARKPVTVLAAQTQSVGSSLALTPSPSEGLGIWSILGSALPLLALLAGLIGVQALDRDQTVSELAEIDAALLTDDLPPSAYSDAGFIQFLRQNTAHASKE